MNVYRWLSYTLASFRQTLLVSLQSTPESAEDIPEPSVADKLIVRKYPKKRQHEEKIFNILLGQSCNFNCGNFLAGVALKIH